MISNNKKRGNDKSETEGKKKNLNNSTIEDDGSSAVDELVFEDPFGDDFDEEDVEAESAMNQDGISENIDEDNDNDEKQKVLPKVWRPDVDGIEEGETLEYDPSAYIMYHALNMEWPCLSFDFIKDNLGDGRHRVCYN
jgi:ribosome assembly protein RRB1